MKRGSGGFIQKRQRERQLRIGGREGGREGTVPDALVLYARLGYEFARRMWRIFWCSLLYQGVGGEIVHQGMQILHPVVDDHKGCT
nr:hypothetical protein CFP56_50363 [Quercus suber]